MYQEIIDEAIRERDAARQAERGSDADEWHPSGLFGCERQAVYSYTDAPETDERQVRNVRIMDRGTEIHEEIQEWVLAKHPGFLPEVKVEYMGVHGSCDGLLPVGEGLPDGDPEMSALATVYELQEYKSESPFARKFRKNQPKEDHVNQARTYYECLTLMGYLLDGIRIVYVDRDDWSVQEYEVEPWTPAEAKLYLWGKIASLNEHVAAETLPDRMPDDFWLCRYCPYYTLCKGDI